MPLNVQEEVAGSRTTGDTGILVVTGYLTCLMVQHLLPLFTWWMLPVGHTVAVPSLRWKEDGCLLCLVAQCELSLATHAGQQQCF